jgi:hypothetical protein
MAMARTSSQPPRKTYRRADPIHQIDVVDVLLPSILPNKGGLFKYKPAAGVESLIRMNLTKKDSRMKVVSSDFEEAGAVKLSLECFSTDVLTKLDSIMDKIRTSDFVNSKLYAGARWICPVVGNAIKATIDFRPKASVSTEVHVHMRTGEKEVLIEAAEMRTAMEKYNGFLGWNVSVQVAPCLFSIEKGTDGNVVVLTFYVSAIYFHEIEIVEVINPPQTLLEE